MNRIFGPLNVHNKEPNCIYGRFTFVKIGKCLNLLREQVFNWIFINKPFLEFHLAAEYCISHRVSLLCKHT